MIEITASTLFGVVLVAACDTAIGTERRFARSWAAAGSRTMIDMSPLHSKNGSEPPAGLIELGEYTFKIADLPQEFDQIHRLLHRTFVVEIPRYDDPGTDYLVDKFHERNVYVIALRNGHVCGMIAVHDQPPFSVAAAIEDAGILDSLGPRVIEARIFAVEQQERLGVAFPGLACSVYQYAKARGCPFDS
jgi:hypothetical protein